jgi:hypothetical protein
MTGSGPPERDPTVGIDSKTADAPATRAEPSGWDAAYTALLVLFIGTAVVAFVLLLVVLPIRDGKKDEDSARETYRNFQSLTYSARWRIDSEIRDVRWGLDSDLYSLDSALWSVGLDLGSLTYDLGADSRPRIRELEGQVDASRDEVDRLRLSAEAQFERLQDSVDARLGELEGVADSAVDSHWDESSRRFSRDGRIIMGALWAIAAGFLAVAIAGLWTSWRDGRAHTQPAAGA